MPAEKPTKNKCSQRDFYGEIAENTGHSRKEVETIMDEAQEILVGALQAGGSVQLGIGVFKRADRAARKGRNPQTGAAMQFHAKNAAKFQPGTKLRDALN